MMPLSPSQMRVQHANAPRPGSRPAYGGAAAPHYVAAGHPYGAAPGYGAPPGYGAGAPPGYGAGGAPPGYGAGAPPGYGAAGAPPGYGAGGPPGYGAAGSQAPAAGSGAKGLPVTKSAFRGIGLLLLVVTCALPIHDAMALLQDFNFDFWVGSNLPVMLIAGLVVTILMFLFSIEALFSQVKPEYQTTQTLVMVVSLFVTIVGLILIVGNLPLGNRAMEAHNTLLFHCGSSVQTRDLRAHYETLMALRQQPACAEKYSVEECDGFKAQTPYTEYVMSLESNYRCAGFCLDAAAASAAQESANVTSAAAARPAAAADATAGAASSEGANASSNASSSATSLLALSASASQQQALRSTWRLGGEARSAAFKGGGASGTFVKERSRRALFSQGEFLVTCEGAAARQLVNFGREIAYQGWYIGVSMITISVAMNLWEWRDVATK